MIWLRKHVLCLITVILAAVLPSLYASDDIMIADFEGKDYGNWKVQGDAFGSGPDTGTLSNSGKIKGSARGKGWVNTYYKGDQTTGTLTSPEFTIERDYITFLVGGGGHKETAIQLLVDGKAVQSQSGYDDEVFYEAMFDVRKYLGKKAQLRIIDNVKGGWGHINIDHILQTDKKPALPDFAFMEKSFTVKCKYLIIPICNKAKKTTLQVYIGSEKIRMYDVPLATDPENVDWYAFFTIEDFKEKDARVAADRAASKGFELVKQSDSIPGQENFYKEPHRPQFHFSQKVGWNNDPNGMVYLNGVWHFFFQHNPVGLPWGNMTWGHAISTDLIYWVQQPNKLFPKTMAVRDCFSGSATVDKNNTSGWGNDTLVAFFTDTGCGECIAYSTDGGKSFTYYKGNPVVKHKGRDPKVIWYEYDKNDAPINARAKDLGGHWVMVVYDQKDGNNAAFYTSVNMKDWTEQSHLSGYFECTELFELPVDGDKGDTRWVVFAADAKYAVGSFDGKVFTPEHEGKHRVHYGKYYASQTFDNSPDGRKIQMGWARIASPGPFNQMFSFPHRLTLRTTESGIRMFAEPIKEIEKLYTKKFEIKNKKLADNVPVSLPVKGAYFDITAVYEIGTSTEILLELPDKTISYDVKNSSLNGAALEPVDGKVTVRILADRSIIEIIGNEGRVYITDEYKFQGQFEQIKVIARRGDAKLIKLEANSIKSIWAK